MSEEKRAFKTSVTFKNKKGPTMQGLIIDNLLGLELISEL
uniref:Uncharacterized protein n=1 Tax=Pseudoalteromonas luteoviolacea TaxID=43657 RepID=A0A023Q0P3_9GAMM|nr:hypothetical protein [Pseudoalteromonas luteoviolacea]